MSGSGAGVVVGVWGWRVFGAGVGDAEGGEVGVAPVVHRVDDRHQGAPQWREGVFGLWGDDGIEAAADEAVGHQLAQLLGQHLRRGVGDGIAQRAVAERPADVQVPKNDGFVFAAEDRQGGLHRAAEGLCFAFGHDSPPFPDGWYVTKRDLFAKIAQLKKRQGLKRKTRRFGSSLGYAVVLSKVS